VVTVAVRGAYEHHGTGARRTLSRLYLIRGSIRSWPNTAGCYRWKTRSGTRALPGGSVSDLIKLEVIGDDKALFPDVIGLLKHGNPLQRKASLFSPLYQR